MTSPTSDAPSTISTKKRAVVLERDIAHRPEKVWRAITQPHLIAEWLMANDFAPKVGHAFQLRNAPQPGIEVVIDCRVLDAEPHHTLRYSWSAFGLDSIVTFSLTPTASGTHLRLEQAGFGPDQDAAFKGARAGWTQFLRSLTTILDRPE
jgi:uncharacterized protein YndB with AHSA1/START domain